MLSLLYPLVLCPCSSFSYNFQVKVISRKEAAKGEKTIMRATKRASLVLVAYTITSEKRKERARESDAIRLYKQKAYCPQCLIVGSQVVRERLCHHWQLMPRVAQQQAMETPHTRTTPLVFKGLLVVWTWQQHTYQHKQACPSVVTRFDFHARTLLQGMSGRQRSVCPVLSASVNGNDLSPKVQHQSCVSPRGFYHVVLFESLTLSALIVDVAQLFYDANTVSLSYGTLRFIK